MARGEGDPIPDDLRPCEDYAASDRFQTWAVEQMRREVMRQVSGAGLDRMAIVKAGAAPAVDGANKSNAARRGR